MNPGKQYVTRAGRQWAISMTRLVYRCAAEASVSERTARGVLFHNWPITSNARERAYRWMGANRVAVDKSKKEAEAADTATNPPAQSATERSAHERALELAREAIEGIAPQDVKRVFDEVFAAERAKISAEASRELDRILAEVEKQTSEP